MAKVFLFIDGSNLYSGQYELFGPDSYIDFSLFIKEIESFLKILFTKIYFYASYSPKSKRPTEKEKVFLKNEGLFYKGVRENRKTVFFKGYRSPTSGKEKEVDVKLTADLVHQAHKNAFDNVFLMTGDADFLQALLIIKKLRKRINIVCIENRIMYKGVYRFPTSVIRFTAKSLIYRKTKLTSEIQIKKERVLKTV